MTKERKLAIEMWQDMRELVSQGRIKDGWQMLGAKRTWLEAHGINWYCECWFCNYFRKAREDGYGGEDDEDVKGKTPKCPLNVHHLFRCNGRCEQYGIVCSEKYPMEKRLEAVDNIIKALKGEYKE